MTQTHTILPLTVSYMTFYNTNASSKHRLIGTDGYFIPKHACFNKYVLLYLQMQQHGVQKVQ